MLRVVQALAAMAVAFLMSAASASAQNEKRVALVIGNSAYRTVGALPNPANDAKLMKSGLEAAGFTVTLAESVGRDAFVTSLRNFRDQADGADWAVVYYAGHGMEIGGTNYLIPVDARLAQDRDIAFEAIPLDQVLAAIEGARGLRMVILDACRNNPFAQTMTRSGGPGRDIGRGLAVVEPTRATLVAYAAKAGTIAADGTGANSPYASSLAKRIAEPGVEVNKLFRLVRDDVLEATGQKQEPFTYGSLPGRQDFYFRPPQVAAVTPPAPQPQPPIPAVDPRLVEAGQVWTTIQNSTSIDVLKAFQTKYAGTVYADIAGARISELQRVAVVPPTPVPAPTPIPVPLPFAAPNPAPGPGPNAGNCGGLVATVGNTAVPAQLLQRCMNPKEGFRDCSNCPEMVVVAGGSFNMGSATNEPERTGDEGPQHRVTIAAPFAVGKYAITFDDWDLCVAGGGCGGRKANDQGWGRGNRPVVDVSWDDAKLYLAWLSRTTGRTYRLLSESEREYVTRAGTTTPFWWGSSIVTTQANYDGDATPYTGGGQKGQSRGKSVPVDSFDANPFGLYNVSGNVWEWTEDCWHGTYDGAPADGKAWTSGPCEFRVYRGGSWISDPGYLRSASRLRDSSNYRSSRIGFRVARDLTGPAANANLTPPTQTAAVAPNPVPAPTPTPVVPNPAPTAVACTGGQVAAVGGGTGIAAAQRCLRPKDTFRDCSTCPEMVVVPAGNFMMGSPAGEPERLANEGPQKRVTFAAPFAVGKFSVTFEEWDACVADGGCGGRKPDDQGWGRGSRPVVDVSWNDAKLYVAWLSRKTGKTYRLLSDSEREYITRAGTTTPFWWGSTITPTQANYDANKVYAGGGQKGVYREKTVPVDSFNANPWGFYNVSGNVWEWVEDCHESALNGVPADGSPRPATANCANHTYRGGSHLSDPDSLRSAARLYGGNDERAGHVGLRVARRL
ncbi:MAG: SUMF1/EgtB/PvdO family nonheme iron enzyme [Bauldia sp.]